MENLDAKCHVHTPATSAELVTCIYSSHSTGMDCLEGLIHHHFNHPEIQNLHCHMISKLSNPSSSMGIFLPFVGHLAPNQTPILAWSKLHIDFIGHWIVELGV